MMCARETALALQARIMRTRILCPKCDARMVLTKVAPLNRDVGLHHYECLRCDRTLQIVTLESAKPNDGWPVEKRAPDAPLLPTAAATLNNAVPWSVSMAKDNTN